MLACLWTRCHVLFRILRHLPAYGPLNHDDFFFFYSPLVLQGRSLPVVPCHPGNPVRINLENIGSPLSFANTGSHIHGSTVNTNLWAWRARCTIRASLSQLALQQRQMSMSENVCKDRTTKDKWKITIWDSKMLCFNHSAYPFKVPVSKI